MNRRDLFKAVLAIPVAGFLGKLLPVEPAADLTKATLGVGRLEAGFVRVGAEWAGTTIEVRPGGNVFKITDIGEFTGVAERSWPNHKLEWIADVLQPREELDVLPGYTQIYESEDGKTKGYRLRAGSGDEPARNGGPGDDEPGDVADGQAADPAGDPEVGRCSGDDPGGDGSAHAAGDAAPAAQSGGDC